MPSKHSRRAILQGTAAAVPAALAGCSVLDSESNTLSVSVGNADDREHLIAVSLLRRDRREFVDARVKWWHHQLAPGEQAEHDNAVPARRYIVRVAVNGNSLDHYHYYPSGCADDVENLTVWVDRPSGDDALAADFVQSWC
ncbi:hypothetical protein [Halorhabdus rudnickae]|uniref:hypothetical protein n=1 Tax=Halorhabdus rudnickae TaxID=1775544 RepID=UPI0010826A50|nr:hypothetical protein [Halorhabdus rudnickae]